MHTVIVTSFGTAQPSNRMSEPAPVVGCSYMWTHPGRPNDAGGIDPDMSRSERDFETTEEAERVAAHIRDAGGEAVVIVPIESVKSWCGACQTASEATGYGCDGHFLCTRPTVPEGYRLTGAKERTSTGWREDVERAS